MPCVLTRQGQSARLKLLQSLKCFVSKKGFESPAWKRLMSLFFIIIIFNKLL